MLANHSAKDSPDSIELPEQIVQHLLFDNTDDFFNLFPLDKVYNVRIDGRESTRCVFSNQGNPYVFMYSDQLSIEIFRLLNDLFHRLPENIQLETYKNHYREEGFFSNIVDHFELYILSERDKTFKKMIDCCYNVRGSQLILPNKNMKIFSFSLNGTSHSLYLMQITLRVFIYRLENLDDGYNKQLVINMESLLFDSYPFLSLAPYYLSNTKKFSHHMLEKALISLFESAEYRLSVAFDPNKAFPIELIRRYNDYFQVNLPTNL